MFPVKSAEPMSKPGTAETDASMTFGWLVEWRNCSDCQKKEVTLAPILDPVVASRLHMPKVTAIEQIVHDLDLPIPNHD